MRLKKTIFLLLIQTLFVQVFVGQHYYLTNLYVHDLFMVNPAAASLQNDCYSLNGYFQKQWLGTDLAPTTQVVSFQKSFVNKLGIGTYVYNDRNGNYRQLGVQQTFAYSLTLTKTKRYYTNLLFGLSLLADQRSLNVSNLGNNGAVDPAIGGGADKGFGYNANTGMMLTVNQWQVGLSFTNIFPYTNSMYSEVDEPHVPMDINFTASTSFKITDRNIYIEPIYYYRWNDSKNSRTDMNIRLWLPSLDPSFATWGMLAYRRTMDKSWGNNLAMLTSVGIIKNGFKVGVEYQLGLTRAQHYYGSAYQLVVGYNFCRNRFNDPIPCSKKAEKMSVGL